MYQACFRIKDNVMDIMNLLTSISAMILGSKLTMSQFNWQQRFQFYHNHHTTVDNVVTIAPRSQFNSQILFLSYNWFPIHGPGVLSFTSCTMTFSVLTVFLHAFDQISLTSQCILIDRCFNNGLERKPPLMIYMSK